MKTAICIASGPSLTQEDVDLCRGKGTVYVVKECHHRAPWADVLYAADEDWWDKFKGVPEFKGKKYTCAPKAAAKYNLIYVEAKHQWHWSDTPGAVATGGNSGFQTMNLATILGAEKLILLGFDYGHDPKLPKHWWEAEYPRESRYSNYADWNKRMDKAAQYIPAKVYNASRESAITCFPRVNLEDVL